MPGWFDRLLSWTGVRTSWSPGAAPNPFAVPSDPSAADGSASDPYHDGQWSPLIAPVLSNPEADQLRADAYVPPYTGPLDLDDYGRETDAMRRAYRDFHRSEPAIRSAIDGKAAAVAALDISVLPEDKDNPDDCQAARFVDWTVSRSPHGWDGLILTILRPALIDGFSIAEKVLKGVDDSARWQGYWGLRHVKGRDTAHLMLRLDGYRNVLGVVNTVRGLRTFSPAKVILFTHAELFDNPFGQSDLRAAYRSAGLIADAYKLWYLALKRCGEPYLHGKVDAPTHRKDLEAALRSLRSSGWAVTSGKDEIALLDLAGAASFEAFERKVRILREDIFLAVRGAYTPFIHSNSGKGEGRGSAVVSQHGGSDPVEELLARAVGRCLTEQLIPDLVRPNFGPGVGLPRVVLGGVNWGEMKTRLDILERAKKLGLSVSAKWAHETLQIPPAANAADELGGPPKGGGGGDGPGAGGPGPKAPRTFASHYDESQHPRDKYGRWIEKELIDRAKTNPRLADYLREQVTGPEEQAKLEQALRPVPSNFIVPTPQQEEWRKRFAGIGIKVDFVWETPYSVRLVLPYSARNRRDHDKIDAMLRLAGLSDDREGGAAGRTEALNAIYSGSADTVNPPGYGDRGAIFDPSNGLAYVGSLEKPKPASATPSGPAPSVDELLDKECLALVDQLGQRLREGKLVRPEEVPQFLGGIARGFFSDGLAGSAEGLWELAKLSQIALLLRSARAMWKGSFGEEFRREIESVKGLNKLQQGVVTELAAYIEAEAKGETYRLSAEAQHALKYVAYIAAKVGVEAIKDPEVKGRVLGFIVYQVAETVALDLATAGAAELARPGRIAAMVPGLAKKLESLGVKADKILELTRDLEKLEQTAKEWKWIERTPARPREPIFEQKPLLPRPEAKQQKNVVPGENPQPAVSTAKEAAKEGGIARGGTNAPPAEVPKSRQRNGKRREYMGHNPDKRSTTYKDVVEQMRKEGKIKTEEGIEKVRASDGTWIPLEEAELSHIHDAVRWWNETGKYWGPKHEKVRIFMTDPKNYVLDKPGLNRSAGGKLKVEYDPPDPRPGGPPQSPPPAAPPKSP